VATRSGRTVPDDAAVRPCAIWSGSLADLVDDLGRDGALQLLVEGGPRLVRAFADDGLVDRWVFHVAPVVAGDPTALPAIAEPDPTSPDRASLARGALVSCAMLGDDLEMVYAVDSRG
jgi:diaminohydroxyphosphoribosylaminopyrimidine deaminase/5-amino-6-(5-phosphoribosylamino)uracil reductase